MTRRPLQATARVSRIALVTLGFFAAMSTCIAEQASAPSQVTLKSTQIAMPDLTAHRGQRMNALIPLGWRVQEQDGALIINPPDAKSDTTELAVFRQLNRRQTQVNAFFDQVEAAIKSKENVDLVLLYESKIGESGLLRIHHIIDQNKETSTAAIIAIPDQEAKYVSGGALYASDEVFYRLGGIDLLMATVGSARLAGEPSAIELQQIDSDTRIDYADSGVTAEYIDLFVNIIESVTHGQVDARQRHRIALAQIADTQHYKPKQRAHMLKQTTHALQAMRQALDQAKSSSHEPYLKWAIHELLLDILRADPLAVGQPTLLQLLSKNRKYLSTNQPTRLAAQNAHLRDMLARIPGTPTQVEFVNLAAMYRSKQFDAFWKKYTKLQPDLFDKLSKSLSTRFLLPPGRHAQYILSSGGPQGLVMRVGGTQGQHAAIKNMLHDKNNKLSVTAGDEPGVFHFKNQGARLTQVLRLTKTGHTIALGDRDTTVDLDRLQRPGKLPLRLSMDVSPLTSFGVAQQLPPYQLIESEIELDNRLAFRIVIHSPSPDIAQTTLALLDLHKAIAGEGNDNPLSILSMDTKTKDSRIIMQSALSPKQTRAFLDRVGQNMVAQYRAKMEREIEMLLIEGLLMTNNFIMQHTIDAMQMHRAAIGNALGGQYHVFGNRWAPTFDYVP